jgi:hypothetical protein
MRDPVVYAASIELRTEKLLMMIRSPGLAFRPSCSECGARLWLARIQPADADHHRHSYECATCGNVEHYMVAAGTPAPWKLIEKTGTNVVPTKRRMA